MFCKFEKVNNTDGGGHDQNSDDDEDDEDTLAMMSTPASRKRRAEHSRHYPRRWAALVAKAHDSNINLHWIGSITGSLYVMKRRELISRP